MKNLFKKIIFLLILLPILSFGQINQKVWYDGNSRAMFYRDALSGDLKDIDTTSTRSEGEGYTAIDLGMHFTPIVVSLPLIFVSIKFLSLKLNLLCLKNKNAPSCN